MHWKFPLNLMGGAQEQQPQSDYEETPQPWYASSANSSSRPSTPPTSSGVSAHGQPSPAEAAEIITRLRDKSVDELRKLLTDKEAYSTFLHSLDQVKNQNNVRDELRRETLRLARENLEKEPRILELRNQCTIIRTTELAAAEERLDELEKRKEELLRSSSPASLLQKLHDAANKAEEESEELQRQLLEKEIDLPAFVQKHKKLRIVYHKRKLLHLAAKTSA